MSETLKACCATHGVALNAEHVTAVGAIGDGTILAKLEALVEKFGPEFAAVMPALLADLAAGNYLAAFELILTTLAA
jgi:hypothetical protein